MLPRHLPDLRERALALRTGHFRKVAASNRSWNLTAVSFGGGAGTDWVRMQPGSDLSAEFPVGLKVELAWLVGGIGDGVYSVASVAYAPPNFTVTLVEDVPTAATLASGTSKLVMLDSRFDALIYAAAEQAQTLEDLSRDMIEDRLLDTAVGAQLDQYGDLLEESRDGLVDAEYRLILAVRILVNTSDATPERIIAIIRGCTNALTGTVRIWTMPPAEWFAQYVVPSALGAALKHRLARYATMATGAGIGPNALVEAVYVTPAGPFFFAFGEPADPATPELTGAAGFGENIADPAGGVLGEDIIHV